MSKVQILIVDDRKLVREGISQLLGDQNGLYAIAEADDPASALKVIKALSPHVVIFSFSLANFSAVAFLRAARAAAPDARLIALTLRPAASLVHDMLQAGAAACLARDSASDELIKAIRAALNGNVYVSPSLAEMV